jgi:hypothetical protein
MGRKIICIRKQYLDIIVKYKRIYLIVLIIYCITSSFSCSSPKSTIVGKWAEDHIPRTITMMLEFLNNGSMTLIFVGDNIKTKHDGKYNFIDDSHIHFKLDTNSEYTYEISFPDKNKMVLDDKKRNIAIFQRLK